MLITLVQVQAGQRGLAQAVLGQHALHSHLHGQLGLLSHQDAVGGLLQAAHPAGVGAVDLLGALLAGQDSLAGVDDDDVVAAVSVGGVSDFAFAAQQVSSPDSGLAQGLTGGVQDVPLTLNVGLVCHKSGHGVSSVSYICMCFTNQVLRGKIGARILIPQETSPVNKNLIYSDKSSQFLQISLIISEILKIDF